ncbi:aminotransferase class I/II-fold pyridoxal phosphate-dependent enzyme [Inediibacterium massiliense]|uniref:methionine gamma-lyase family protein n=1 Tax=Inediibacterium massiliense TaxID=1658111 RepID=UPI0006B61B17|nr:methionine gamma-lyase family protein [Inediibacterium massiliense]
MGIYTKEFLKKHMNISEKVVDLAQKIEEEVKDQFEKINDIRELNQYKVLKVMQDMRVSDMHFQWNTGYGYNDPGREKIEEVYAALFKAEDAIVRPTIVNGTHALTLCLTGILRPNDEMLSVTGRPYDTLEEVIGIRGDYNGSLKEFGVTYKEIGFLEDGSIDIEKMKQSITPKTKMVYMQRSTGYSFRKAVQIEDMKKVVEVAKKINPNIICMVDNCYGEFLDTIEPTEVGVDILAGSLIKNPGGGLALTGGYIVGRKDLIEMISYRMTSPGIGKECGLTFGMTRSMFQGLFLAPHVVSEAIKGAIFCAKLFDHLGYEVSPSFDEKRSDIIQAIKLRSPEAVVAFCEGIQGAAPVDGFVTPVPWNMPGYDSPVIMAAGAFVQGSSIELSADAPIKEPYAVYFQGGLTYEHAKFGALKGLQSLIDKGCIEL